jgi:hypothetical protein
MDAHQHIDGLDAAPRGDCKFSPNWTVSAHVVPEHHLRVACAGPTCLLVASRFGRDNNDSGAGQRRPDGDNQLSKVHTWRQHYLIQDEHATDRLP